MAALPAFGVLLVVAFLGKFRGKLGAGAIAVLFSFCVAVSAGAAVLDAYPLGGIRQGIYLGPIVFLAVGLAFHSGADALASTARQAWLGPLLIVLSASAIVFSGVDALRRMDLYRPHDKGEEILSVLQERAQEDDVLYYNRDMRELIKFHGKPNWGRLVFDGKVGCWHGEELCLQEMIDEITPWIGRSRLWLVSKYPLPFLGMLQTMAAHVPVEHVVSGGTPNLYLIEDAESLIQIATATDMFRDIKPILPGELLIRTTFDIYLHENMLVYFKALLSHKLCLIRELGPPSFGIMRLTKTRMNKGDPSSWRTIAQSSLSCSSWRRDMNSRRWPGASTRDAVCAA